MTLRTALQEFQDASLIRRVAVRFAMEFPTEEARKKYLKDHPDADPSNHKVVKKELGKLPKGDHSFYRDSVKGLKSIGAISRFRKRLEKLEGEEAKKVLDQVVDAGSELHDLGVAVHKRLQGLKGKNAEREFETLKGSLREMETALKEAKDGSMPSFSASQLAKAAEKLYGDMDRIGAQSVAGTL